MTFKDTFVYALITALLMIFVFIMGYGEPKLHRQAIYFRTHFNLGDFTTKEHARAKSHYWKEFKSGGHQKALSNKIQCPFEVKSSCRRVSGLAAYAPRYFLFHPSFELSEFTYIDVAYFFSAQIIIFVFAFVLITMNIGLHLGTVRSNIGLLIISAFGLLLFVLANGRSVPAVTGFALISLAIIKFREGKARILRASTIGIGLVLCAMSTNLFLISFMFFLIASFTPLRNIFLLDPPANSGQRKQDFQSNYNLRVEDILLALIGILYSTLLIFRLVNHYGPRELLSGVLSHGAGKVLLEQPIPLTVGIVSFFILGTAFFIRIVMTHKPQWNIDRRLRIVLLLACFPALGIVFGFVAVSLCFTGAALLVVYFVEIWNNRARLARMIK